MDSEVKNYELAYMLSPGISEDNVASAAGKLSGFIEEIKGLIKRAETPKKRRLAYPIKKEQNGYFGWITFTAPPDSIKTLEGKVKTGEHLLRHLILEEEIETRVPYARPLSRRTPSTQKAAPQQVPDAKQPEEKLDLEALDKKLEEILGK